MKTTTRLERTLAKMHKPTREPPDDSLWRLFKAPILDKLLNEWADNRQRNKLDDVLERLGFQKKRKKRKR
jgi:hypothetical protein